MNKKILTSLLLSSVLLCSIPAVHLAQASDKNATYEWNYQGEGYTSSSKGSTIVRNGVTYVDFSNLARLAGVEYTLDKTGKRAAFNGWMKKIAVRDGSQTAMLDGKQIHLQGAAFFKNDKTMDLPLVYVPFKFAVQALNGTFNGYNAKTHRVKASDIPNYSVISEVYKGTTYTVTKSNGDLFTTTGKNQPIQLTSLNTSLDWGDIKISSTPGRLLLITVDNTYGEPHINSQQFQLLFKKGQLIRRNDVDWRWGRPNLIDRYNNNIIMNDGKVLRIIEDKSGKVLESINLVDLGGKGKDQQYSIEAIDDDIMLIRNAADYQLQLINRKTGKSTNLFEQLLTPEEQEYVKLDSGPMSSGDGVTFTKRTGNTLYFTVHSPAFDKKMVTYHLDKQNNN